MPSVYACVCVCVCVCFCWRVCKHCECPELGFVCILTCLSVDGCRQLELLRLYREGKKATVVSKTLAAAVTTDVHMYPSFGRPVFAECEVSECVLWRL